MQGKALDIASVFYALALLHLPKLSMAQNFVHAVEAGSELQVSMKRINDFLSLPEPPAPAHHSQGPPGLAAKVSVGSWLLALGSWLCSLLSALCSVRKIWWQVCIWIGFVLMSGSMHVVSLVWHSPMEACFHTALYSNALGGTAQRVTALCGTALQRAYATSPCTVGSEILLLFMKKSRCRRLAGHVSVVCAGLCKDRWGNCCCPWRGRL